VFEPGIFDNMIPCNQCEYAHASRLCLPRCPLVTETEVKECIEIEEMCRNDVGVVGPNRRFDALRQTTDEHFGCTTKNQTVTGHNGEPPTFADPYRKST